MRRLAIALVPLFLLACDREPVGPAADVTPTVGATNTWESWTQYLEVPIYFDCIDETLLITGWAGGRDHYITPPSHGGTRTRDVHFQYPWTDYQATGTVTGHVWLPLTYTSHGNFVGDEFAAFSENLRLENQTTGAVVRLQDWWYFVTNAQGEVKVDRFEMRCTLRP